jgi:hypothetical protein
MERIIKKLKNELKTKRDNIAHMDEKIQYYTEFKPKEMKAADELEAAIEVLEKHYAEKK